MQFTDTEVFAKVGLFYMKNEKLTQELAAQLEFIKYQEQRIKDLEEELDSLDPDEEDPGEDGPADNA